MAKATETKEPEEWAPKAGENAYWTYGERGILVEVKSVPKDATGKVTVLGPNGRDVEVPRANLQEPPSDDELRAIALEQDGG